jgi:hypothetical protein
MGVPALAATVYAASIPRLAVKFPEVSPDELWVEDIKACMRAARSVPGFQGSDAR